MSVKLNKKKILNNSKIKNIVYQIKKKYNPEKIILFGSYAKGTENEKSDIDLLIIKETDKKFNKRTEEVLNKIEYDIPIDVFVYTPEEFKKSNKLIEKALNEGIEL
ncbi:MAG: nucleotidyltransferase domain-containing protein [Candidatus Woesearchaeota archaeon]